MQQPRILLISNHWEWSLLALLSLIIRILTYGPNHAAILIDGQVHEMVGSSWRWMLRKLLRLPVSYEANKGCGYKITPYAEWLVAKRRIVEAYEPLVALQEVEIRQGYGFLDLIQNFLRIVRRVWFLIGHEWNGKDGVRLWPGMTCIEFIALKLGRKDGHTKAPADARLFVELRYMETFTT